VRHLCTRAEATVPHIRVLGSALLVDAIKSAIDDYAEREMGASRIFLGQAAQGGVSAGVLRVSGKVRLQLRP
jgi:hypothetical protein